MRSTRRRLSALAVLALVAGSTLVAAPAHALINYVDAEPGPYVSSSDVTVEVDFEGAPNGTPWVTINGNPVAADFVVRHLDDRPRRHRFGECGLGERLPQLQPHARQQGHRDRLVVGRW